MNPRLYGGVRMVDGPCLANIRRLDANAMPLIIRMAQTGLQVDLSHFAKMEIALTQDMERLTEEVRTDTGYYCNLGSGDQVADLLFKKLGLKQARVKMTPSGERESVEDAVLKAVQHEHPVISKIQDYKEIEKLRGTYVRPMPKLAKRVAFGEWRMFPNFRTTRVPSGRLSCSDPNLLAMPTRTDKGREIRRGFIAKTGYCYLSVDESQIEMRGAAHRSQDPALMKVYQNEEDVYSDFAIQAFRLKDERYKDPVSGAWKYPHVDKMIHRYPAKTCILAALYRVTAPGLMEQMPVVCANCLKAAGEHDCGRFRALWDEGKCQDILNQFYIRYAGLLRMQKADDSYVRRYALQHDAWGRILHVAAVRSVLDWVVSTALREAGNFPIQSLAQGTVKLTMAAVHDDLEMADMWDVVAPLLQIHDELLFEVREDMALELAELVKWRFETCCTLNVPIKASAAMANDWGSIPK